MTVSRQCRLVGLSKTAYHYQRRSMKPEIKKLLDEIDEIYTKAPFYGTRKIRKELQKRGYQAGRKGIRRLMKILGVETIFPKKRLSVPNQEHRKYPYLLRGFNTNRSNQVWCSDITYIRLAHGFVYLATVLDWYSRYVLAWQLSTILDANFCVEVLREALRHGTPEIFNVDQGAQFTSKDWINTLKARKVSISMDGRGRYLDNIFIERLWRSVKQEKLYRYSFEYTRRR